MLFFDVLGNIGMILITISLIPQVIKTYKDKEVENISLVFCLSQLVAGGCMVPYGIYLKSIPIIIINIGMTVNQLILLYFIITFKRKNIELEIEKGDI